MQPYQEAADATRRSGEVPLNALKYAGGVALGTAGSMVAKNAMSKIIPFLSQYVPESFAKKGLSKIDGRLGQFINKAESEGFDFGEIREFFEEKLRKTEEDEKNPKDDRNVIQKYSPELHQFLNEKIQGGEDPVRAAALALFEKGNPFEPTIRKIEKEHKTNWSSLVQSIYGGQGQAQQPQQQPQQPAQSQASPASQAFLQAIQEGTNQLRKLKGG